MANEKQNKTVLEYAREVITKLALEATAAERPPVPTKGSDQEEKEIAALRTLFDTDPHLSKLCKDGFGIPGVKLVAHVTGKEYLNRIFPYKKLSKELTPFVMWKTMDGTFHIVSDPYNTTSSYSFSIDRQNGYVCSVSFNHGNGDYASDDEIKSLIAKMDSKGVAALIQHKTVGAILSPILFESKLAQ